MILVNTETVPGFRIVRMMGVVQGNTVRAKHVGRDISASFKNLVGGELKGYTDLLTEASPGIIRWRWTVCVALHMGCTFVAGLGFIRVWRDAWEKRTRPNISLAIPYLAIAILMHALYNALAVALEMMKIEI